MIMYCKKPIKHAHKAKKRLSITTFVDQMVKYTRKNVIETNVWLSVCVRLVNTEQNAYRKNSRLQGKESGWERQGGRCHSLSDGEDLFDERRFPTVDFDDAHRFDQFGHELHSFVHRSEHSSSIERERENARRLASSRGLTVV